MFLSFFVVVIVAIKPDIYHRQPKLTPREARNLLFNRPSLWRPPVYKLGRFFLVGGGGSVGLTYEQSAVKLVVRVLKSGTALCKTHAHISLLNVTYVCSCLLIYIILDMNGKGLLSLGFLHLSCMTHGQLSKATNRIECEIGCVV